MLVYRLSFVFVAIVVSHASAKPELAVYYESLCPYSRDFIRQEVFPAYQRVNEYLDVRFIAYGNAQVSYKGRMSLTMLTIHTYRMSHEKSPKHQNDLEAS